MNRAIEMIAQNRVIRQKTSNETSNKNTYFTHSAAPLAFVNALGNSAIFFAGAKFTSVAKTLSLAYKGILLSGGSFWVNYTNLTKLADEDNPSNSFLPKDEETKASSIKQAVNDIALPILLFTANALSNLPGIRQWKHATTLATYMCSKAAFHSLNSSDFIAPAVRANDQAIDNGENSTNIVNTTSVILPVLILFKQIQKTLTIIKKTQTTWVFLCI